MATDTHYRKHHSNPDEVRSFSKGKVELVNLQGVTVGRAVFEPGWKWSECVKPIAGTKSCEEAHTAYVLSGRMHVVMDNGDQIDYGPGDVMVLPNGHEAWTLGNEPCVIIDFSGMTHYAKTK